jgi:hypothetical protein
VYPGVNGLADPELLVGDELARGMGGVYVEDEVGTLRVDHIVQLDI